MRTILIVEDDRYTRETLCYYLSNELNFKCIEAKSNTDALNALMANDVDIVLCDFLLEGDTAIPVINHVKSMIDKPSLVIMSAMSHIEDTVKMFNVQGLLKKPFDLEALENTLRKLH